MFSILPNVEFLFFILPVVAILFGLFVIVNPNYMWKLRERHYKRMGLVSTGKPEGWDNQNTLRGILAIIGAIIISIIVAFELHIIHLR